MSAGLQSSVSLDSLYTSPPRRNHVRVAKDVISATRELSRPPSSECVRPARVVSDWQCQPRWRTELVLCDDPVAGDCRREARAFFLL